jgi:tetratricopeptide (TPR) repeat protein
MIKYIGFILSLSLISCTSAPDLRPSVYSHADNLLTLGVEAYRQDYYQRAEKHFNQAIVLYQSVADGINSYKTRLNLANTLLAYSNFSAAKQQIKLLKQHIMEQALAPELRRRLILLEVKFYFLQQDYATALNVIEPLLTQSDFKLTMLATLARLEILNSAATQRHWMKKFERALTNIEDPKPIKSQQILTGLLAYIATKNEDYPQAKTLLTQLLIAYQQHANRRGIAQCLEKLAALALIQNHQQQARIYWNQALTIRLWLKDVYRAEKIRQLLKKLDNPLPFVTRQ